MEIVIYRRQRVDYGEQSDTTCLVPKFAFCVAGPSEFFIQRFSIERSRTASPVAVLQRAINSHDIDSCQTKLDGGFPGAMSILQSNNSAMWVCHRDLKQFRTKGICMYIYIYIYIYKYVSIYMHTHCQVIFLLFQAPAMLVTIIATLRLDRQTSLSKHIALRRTCPSTLRWASCGPGTYARTTGCPAQGCY